MDLFFEFLRQQSTPDHCIKQLFMCILDILQLPFLNIYIKQQWNISGEQDTFFTNDFSPTIEEKNRWTCE